MTYFKHVTGNDLTTFEGQVVTNTSPVVDKKSREITHYRFSVVQKDGDIAIRKFRIEEIRHLFDTERLIVDHGYHSPQRQRDRALYGARDLVGATRTQRDRIDLLMECNHLMDRYRAMGMPLTRAGVDSFRAMMSADYENYQARKLYGTEKANSTQRLKRLPTADTLLTNYRRFRKANGNPNTFLAPLAEPIDDDLQASADFCFVVERLGAYACSTRPSKAKIIRKLIKELEGINAQRKAMRRSDLFTIFSQRSYERWIDLYLDPFLVTVQRDGLAAAQKKFGSVEGGRTATAIGELVMTDAWKFHIVTLDCTREAYNRMNEEERKRVKRRRFWVTTMMDIASRCILGFSICRTPNEQASLEALRMAFMDKTYLLREIGIKESNWDFFCAIQEIVNDNGSEFGKEPFGGALFTRAALLLSSSQMNTVAGVSSLRGYMERFYWTSDQKWARYLPGYTAQNPQARNDRKFMSEVCITHDELHTLFTAFIAEYHKTPHRGLNFRTPASVWEDLSKGVDYDISQMPMPGQLRDACGFYAKAKVSEVGIRFAGTVYSNEFVRNQRKARAIDRIAQPGETVEIKVDPFDLGGISVVANGDLISVRCLDESMTGRSLREWNIEKSNRRELAKAEAASQNGARDEAARIWENLAQSVMRNADIGMFGYTQAEIERAARELEFGKGHREKPFIGRDEYLDPVFDAGFETGGNLADDGTPDHDETLVDQATSLDRFRQRRVNSKLKKDME